MQYCCSINCYQCYFISSVQAKRAARMRIIISPGSHQEVFSKYAFVVLSFCNTYAQSKAFFAERKSSRPLLNVGGAALRLLGNNNTSCTLTPSHREQSFFFPVHSLAVFVCMARVLLLGRLCTCSVPLHHCIISYSRISEYYPVWPGVRR